MKKSKFLNLLVLLLAVVVLFVSCNQEQEVETPRETTDEDTALVTDVVKDVSNPEDYSTALDPYFNDLVNYLFSGDGEDVDNVTFKFPADYKYEGGISGIAGIHLVIGFDEVTVTSGSFSGKKVSGTLYYNGDPKTVTADNLKFDSVEYTGNVVDFFNDVFCDSILSDCLEEFFKEGIELNGDKLKVEAKGSIEYEDKKDEAGNEYTTIKSMSLTSFSMETKEDLQVKENGNKYSLVLRGKGELGFTAEKNSETGEYEDKLTKISIPSVTFTLGITNSTGKHSIELTTSFNYPSSATITSLTGLNPIPFTFVISEAKIDGQLIDNTSMMTLITKALTGLFTNLK